MLVRWQLDNVWLHLVGELLDLLVGGEVGTLVGRLPQRGQRHTTIQRRHTLFTYDSVHCMTSITVSRDFERIGE